MKASILAIGDEVLSGRVVNTNAAYLASKLQLIGIDTKKVICVGDDTTSINHEIADFLESDCDLLITTGGLGPTHDDFTKETICQYLGLDLVENNEAKRIVEDYFKGDYSNCNAKQFLFPKDAIVLPNKIGTACGMIVKHHSKTIVILVGPPIEMQPMFEQYVLNYLQTQVKNNQLIKEYIVMGLCESEMEEVVQRIAKEFKNVTINPYFSVGFIRYQIKGIKRASREFSNACKAFYTTFKGNIISDKNETIEEVLVSLLINKGYTISFAESCTGGILASKIINVSGSSRVLNESFVTYANEAKTKYLNVNPKTISKYDVVSDEVVNEMVKGLSLLTRANVCVSVSGLAGPTGGTKEKPVGLVHYGIKINGKIIIEHREFNGDRQLIRNRAAMWILFRIYQLLNDF